MSLVALANRRVHPYAVLLISLLPGFALIGGSILLNIATWTAVPPKQTAVTREVGYLGALNWSVTYAVLFPAALYLMSSTIRGLMTSLKRLHERGMVRAQDMEPISAFTLASLWEERTNIRKYVLLIFAVCIPLFIAWNEWYKNNLQRIFHRAVASKFSDYDWGLAAIMSRPEWSPSMKLANAIFDLLAFTTEALLISSLLSFFILMLDLGRIIPSAMHDSDFKLVPDLRFKDRRLGFEEFEAPLENLLGVALVGFLICYLVRVEGAYLASENASSLFEFVRNDIFAGVVEGLKAASFAGIIDAIASLFVLKSQLRGDLAWLMSVLIAIFSLTTVVVTVREAARCAKENALRGLEDGSLILQEYDKQTSIEKIQRMVIWPLGYLRLDLLLLSTFVAVFTLLFYRLGLIMALLVSLSLAVRLAQRLVRPSFSKRALPARPAIIIGGNLVSTDNSTRNSTTNLTISSQRDTIVSGNITVAENIRGSFIRDVKAAHASEALKDQLVTLNSAVAEMCTHLTEADAKKVEKDLANLNHEAVSKEPDTDYFDLSAKRIQSVAETVGVVAGPVVSAVKAISGLLGF